jgi:LysM repeat protein
MTLQNKLLTILFLFFTFHISNAQKPSEKQLLSSNDTTKLNYLTPNQKSITDSIINFGKIFLNTPYRYGSAGTSTFDCSGFTSHVYRNFGYNLNRSSAAQAHQFDTVKRGQLKSGDLVYFSGRRSNGHVGHVGIVVSAQEDGNFDFIHASVQRGVIISNSEEDYYRRRFIKANRVICDNKMLSVAPCDAIQEIDFAKKISSKPVTVAVRETKKIIPAEYHRVKSGETLSSISNKYGISIAELKLKNNLKRSKIKPNQNLKIKNQETILLVETLQPVENNSTTPAKNELAKTEPELTTTAPYIATHTVKKGETLFGISKLYNISVDELKKLNKLTKNTINFGDKIKLTSAEKPVLAKTETTALAPELSETPKTDKNNKVEQQAITTHKVEPGESLFSISKKYNISVDNLKKLNQITNNNIQPGQKLKLGQQEDKKLANTDDKKKITHKVKSGESFYTIAKTYGCTINNIKEWNNKSENKLITGEKIIIYSKTI